MKTTRYLLVPAALALLVSACVGTDFKRPDASAFEIGKTTTSDLLKVMGPPNRTGELVKNAAQVKQLTYVYASKLGAEPLHPGVTPARAMTFSTYNDVMVGEQFISSFKDDGTDFDAAKVGLVIKGRSSRADVIAVFGPPGGQATYPIISSKGDTAIVYAYVQTTGGPFNLKFYQKVLTVSLDANDMVSDVQYIEVGNK